MKLSCFRGGRLMVAAASLCASAFLNAQKPVSPAPLTAHDLAQRVDKHYNHLHSLRSGFSETYEGLGVHRTETGTLLLEKPGRMRWDYSSPKGKLFVLDGKYAWFYSPSDPHVERTPAKQLDDLRSPLRFLLGHTELERELDHIALTSASNGIFTLAGQPKGLEKRVSRLALSVTTDGTITGIEIEETDGATTQFTFTGEQPDAPMPAGSFHFTPPPGIPVIDSLSPI